MNDKLLIKSLKLLRYEDLERVPDMVSSADTSVVWADIGEKSYYYIKGDPMNILALISVLLVELVANSYGYKLDTVSYEEAMNTLMKYCTSAMRTASWLLQRRHVSDADFKEAGTVQ